MAKQSMGELAFLAVVIMAVGNAGGRIVAGSLSDRIGRTPVSYTHLDVYKRQSLLFSNHNNEKLRSEVEMNCQPICPFYGQGIDSVSYTHLDVYKRQEFDAQCRWCDVGGWSVGGWHHAQ